MQVILGNAQSICEVVDKYIFFFHMVLFFFIFGLVLPSVLLPKLRVQLKRCFGTRAGVTFGAGALLGSMVLPTLFSRCCALQPAVR